MNRELRDDLFALAREAAPREACGLLVDDNGELDLWQARNVSVDEHTFLMDPRDQYRFMDRIWKEEHLELAGIWHSHPRGPAALSDTDRELHRYPVPIVLVSLEPEAICWFEPEPKP